MGPFDDGIGARIFGCEFFVDVDAEAGFVVRIHIAVSDLRQTREDFVAEFVEAAPFLDPEVRGPEVEVQVGSVADGGGVSRAVPRGSDIIYVGE